MAHRGSGLHNVVLGPVLDRTGERLITTGLSTVDLQLGAEARKRFGAGLVSTELVAWEYGPEIDPQNPQIDRHAA